MCAVDQLARQYRPAWSDTRNVVLHCVQMARPNTYMSAVATAGC